MSKSLSIEDLGIPIFIIIGRGCTIETVLTPIANALVTAFLTPTLFVIVIILIKIQSEITNEVL